jgi:hypothetical protein
MTTKKNNKKRVFPKRKPLRCIIFNSDGWVQNAKNAIEGQTKQRFFESSRKFPHFEPYFQFQMVRF